MNPLMERLADREGRGSKEQEGQQTNERWFRQAAKAGKLLFPLHLYVDTQPHNPRGRKWKHPGCARGSFCGQKSCLLQAFGWARVKRTFKTNVQLNAQTG
jgi:hypothetical protein